MLLIHNLHVIRHSNATTITEEELHKLNTMWWIMGKVLFNHINAQSHVLSHQLKLQLQKYKK